MTSDAVSAERRLRPSTPPFQPAADVLSGETADVYFERTRRILATEGLDPVVTMEIFCRADAILCGAQEAIAYLREILGNGKRLQPAPVVESLHDGDAITSKEVVMRINARYSAFGLYETAILGILSQSTGWATAARRIVDAAAPIPVIGFGARHVHPSIADQMDYASVVGGCIARRLLRGGIGDQRREPHRLHRGPEGDRGPAHREARPNSRPDREPAPRADRAYPVARMACRPGEPGDPGERDTAYELFRR